MKNFFNCNGYLEKFSKKIEKKSPYSNDLENFQITSENIKENIDGSLDEEVFKNFDNFLKNFGVFFEITGNVKKALERNFNSLPNLGKEFSSENIEEINLLLDKKNIKEIIEKLEKTSDEEEKNILLKKFLDELKKDEKFLIIFEKYFKNDDDFLEKFSELKKVFEKISEDKNLELNLFGDFSGKLNKNFLKNIQTYKIAIISLIFGSTSIYDIDAITRVLAPQADIAMNYFDKFSMIADNINAGLIGYSDIMIGALPSITDVGFKLAFAHYLVTVLSSTKNRNLKNFTKLGGSALGMVLSVGSAALLQGTSGTISSIGNAEKVKEIKSFTVKNEKNVNGSIIEDGSVTVNGITAYIDNTKKDIEGVFDISSEFLKVFSEAFGVVHSGGEKVKVFDSEKELKILIEKIKNGELDNSGQFAKMNSYISQIEKIGNLDEMYRDMFNQVLKDINGKASNGIALYGPSSHEKLTEILRISGHSNLESLVGDLYKNNKKEGDLILLDIYKKIELNSETFTPYFEKNNGLTLEEIKKEFIEKNSEKIFSFKDDLKNFIINIEKTGITDTKISEFNKIIKDFNYFISSDLEKNIENFTNGVNFVKANVEKKFRKIDEKYKNENVSYEEISLKNKVLNTDEKIKQLPEKYITGEDVLNELKLGISYYKETGKIKKSLVSAINNLELSLLLNFTDISLILILIGFSYGRNNKKIKIREEKLEGYKKEIYGILNEFSEIFKNQSEIAKKSKINPEKIKEIKEFIEKFGIHREENSDLFLYSKESKTIDPEFNFMGGKLKQTKKISNLKIHPEKFSNLGAKDSVFITEFEKNGLVESVGIKNLENGGFEIVVNEKGDCEKILDFKSKEFKDILDETLASKGNDIFSLNRSMLGILIRKDGFIILKYDKKLKMNVLNEDDINKYIK